MSKSKRSWYDFRNATETEVDVYLYDEIGFWGIGAKAFISELRQHAGKHVHLRINSPGGEVIEGTAILNALRRHAAGVTVHIDALAASMASAIAMSGNPVFMAANALMMIHDPYTFAAGTSEELRKSADLLDTMKGNLVRAYTQKTGLPEKEIEDMMAEETWLGATEAVALGFVDAIEDGVAAAAQVTPEKARARFDTLKKVMADSPQDTITQEPPDEPIVPETEPVAETNEAPAPEPTVVPHPPVEPTDPVARVDVAAITAQLTEAYARIERAEARAAKAEADLHTVQATLSNLEKSKGLSPAAVVPEVKPESQILSKTDFDALSPYAKAEFFRRGGKLS